MPDDQIVSAREILEAAGAEKRRERSSTTTRRFKHR
jgi:hypothetical protein